MKQLLARMVLMAGAALAGIPGTAVAADGGAQSASPPPRSRGAVALAITSWSDLADLAPGLDGDFDETGVGIDLAFHTRVGRLGRAVILAGADFGIASFESDIEGIVEGEDLVASFYYITPSVKLAFGSTARRQFFIDAGVGWYSATIEEYDDDDWWDSDIYEYYDDSTLGGYVGLGADFAVSGNWRVTTSLRTHFVDFDAPGGELGAGNLGGPVWQWQFGGAFGFGQ
jgi:hypothetical protein